MRIAYLDKCEEYEKMSQVSGVTNICLALECEKSANKIHDSRYSDFQPDTRTREKRVDLRGK
jgi:hypothetical protein